MQRAWPFLALCGIIIALFFHFFGSSDSVTTAQAVPEPQTQPADGNDTAILFLIDDSGGVSGRCGNDTADEKDRRYDVPRFFLALFRTYYSPQCKFPTKPGVVDDDLPRLQFGVAQFAKTYTSMLPLTPIENLIDSDLGEAVYRKLGSAEEMLAPFSEGWFCETAYPQALEEAASTLEQSGASKRILVLLTDGSFRGSYLEDPDQYRREKTRSEAEKMVKNLWNTGIQTCVLVWGRHHQYTQPYDCGVGDAECELYQGDLRAWEAWEKRRFLSLWDEQTPFKSVGEGSAMADLLPARRYRPAGWLSNQRGNKVPLILYGQTRGARVVVIPSQDVDIEAFAVRNEYDIGVSKRVGGPQWLIYEDLTILPPTGEDCPAHEWSLSKWSSSDTVAYYWLVQDYKGPDLQISSVSPETVILNKDQQITVTVQLVTPLPWYPHCYRVTTIVGDEAISKTFGREGKPLDFSFTLPADLPWGPVPITAELVYVNSPQTWAALPLTGRVQVEYEPYIHEDRIKVTPSSKEEWDDMEQAETGLVTVTVPFSYANKVPEGIKPRFALFPEPFKELPPDTKSYCVSTVITQAEKVANVTRWVDDPDVIYRAVFPYQQVLENRCGYRYLHLRWSMPDGTERTRWYEFSFQSSPPAITLRPMLTHTPTPTPTSTPTSVPSPTPTPLDGDGLPWWRIVVIVGVVLLLLAALVLVVQRILRRT